MQVNKIREVPQHPHIVVTHTDKPQLYVWNLETQPNRASDKVIPYPPTVLALLTAGHVCCVYTAGLGNSDVPVWQLSGKQSHAVYPELMVRLLTVPQDEERMRLSVADLTLTGHKQDAKFAVAISSAEPLVASGGDDAEVRLAGYLGSTLMMRVHRTSSFEDRLQMT